MEQHIQSTEDSLKDSLSFKLPSSANFVQSRRSISFFPQGGNQFSPNGTRIIKFILTGSESWVDPSTIRVQFKFSNLDTEKPLKLVSALPSNMIRRVRLISQGAVVEDLDFYSRLYNMIHTMMPFEKRVNDYAEGFGLSQEFGKAGDIETGDRLGNIGIGLEATNEQPTIPKGGNRVVIFPLLCGLFNQSKFLPLKYMSLQVELEVVSSYFDCICSSKDDAGTYDTWSTKWEISEPQIKCDVISLDNELDNEYTSHLLSGKTLPIAFSSFSHSMQSISGNPRPSVSLARSFTRLKTVYVTFYKTPYVTTWVNGVAMQDVTKPAIELGLNESNFFYHPAFCYPGKHINEQNADENISDNSYYTHQYNSEVELQLCIGSKLFPELPIRSSAEAYYHLRKCLGCHHIGGSYSMNIMNREYRSHKFIVGFDTERVSNAYATGLNTRSGDLITIKCTNLQHIDNRGVTWDNSTPDLMFCLLEYDGLLIISDGGDYSFRVNKVMLYEPKI